MESVGGGKSAVMRDPAGPLPTVLCPHRGEYRGSRGLQEDAEGLSLPFWDPPPVSTNNTKVLEKVTEE